MAKQVGGRRYAQALFELAIQQDQAPQWSEELGYMAQVLLDPEFNSFLKHTGVPVDRKTTAIETVLPEINPLVRNLGALLVSRGAVDVLGDVSIGFNRLLDERLGRQPVEVTAAVPLEDAELERIRRFVTDLIQREVVVTTRVDESILGGIIIQIGDRLLDGSTRSKLEALRKQIRSEVALG